MQWIGGMAALISVIFAGIAVIFSLAIHCQTRKLLKRTERPIISLDMPKCESGLISGSQIRVDLKFAFHNIGKNPAQGLRMRMGACLKQMPQLFKNYADASMANRIDPQRKFTWETHLEHPAPSGKELQPEEIHFLLYILVTYKDMFDPGTEYHDEFYLEYTASENTAGDARMENRLSLKPYLEKVYGRHAA